MSYIGFAVDLGTTTIDYCLVDMMDCHVIEQSSFLNPQSLYGSDVINRIMTITRDAAFAEVLKSQVVDALNTHFISMLEHNGYVSSDVSRISICGNTTMVSILLGRDVKCLGEAPFIPDLKDDVCILANQLFGDESELVCPVILSGCASAFVGGDILAGMNYLKDYYSAEAFANRNCLFIDLGTNGEIVLYTNNQYYGAATACGPAFEGCTRRQKVYGATTIETIALCVSLGKILPNGSFAKDSMEQLTVNKVTLTLDVLHSILLAKAAIAAGIETICEQATVQMKDIDYVYLAGGFGFHLDLESAIKIGLIPKILKDKIKIVGNTSLEGAKLFLNDKYISRINKDTMKILNFAEIPSYQDKFIQNMYFQPIN